MFDFRPNEGPLERLRRWMRQPEHTLEFKEAKQTYSFDKLREYCAAISNEGGGALVLGVSDLSPRRVVGSHSFPDHEKTSSQLLEQFRMRFDFEELRHPDGRVLIVHIPGHPLARPLQVDGRYLMRSGESTVPMTPDQLSKLLTRDEPDFSAMICSTASLEDLDSGAVQRFRLLLQERSRNLIAESLDSSQFLADHDLLSNGKVTNAALLLLGKTSSVIRLLPQAEVIFEFRNDESSIRYQHRNEYRGGFLLWQEDLWQAINLRNDVQLMQEGFFNRSIPTFNEVVVREAVLNAVSHRDYQSVGSTFVRQTSTMLEVVSPGGFPSGITAQNVLQKQSPRNRRLAEALQRCGLIERSGQGVDLMFNASLREGKRQPDYSGTDAHEVKLMLRGEVQNPQFVKFLEKIGSERGVRFSTEDLIVLDHISRADRIPEICKPRISGLLDEGVIERVGKGRGVRFLLSRRFYSFLGRPGGYTHKLGLDREANKALLLMHIRRNENRGAALQELQQVLPAASRSELKSLLRELREQNSVRMTGSTRGARYFTPDDLLKSSSKVYPFPIAANADTN